MPQMKKSKGLKRPGGGCDLTNVEIYTDGSAKGNPGPGGYGTIIVYVDQKGVVHEKELTEGYADTTNNRMELMGVIAGLECLNRPCHVELYSDSKYVTDAFNKGWIDSWQEKGWKKADKSPVLNVDLWKRLLDAARPHEIVFNWIKGHAGHEYNERCDRLAVSSAKKVLRD